MVSRPVNPEKKSCVPKHEQKKTMKTKQSLKTTTKSET